VNRFPTKILLATEGSEDAKLAASAAVGISNATGSELHLVHVLEQFPRYAYPGITSQLYSLARDEQERQGREHLAGEVERMRDGGGNVAEVHVRRGPLADEILDLAENVGAGLIVMGSRGLGVVKHLVMGSVSEVSSTMPLVPYSYFAEDRSCGLPRGWLSRTTPGSGQGSGSPWVTLRAPCWKRPKKARLKRRSWPWAAMDLT
jgi:nucleotide-binding universal stress UspA family protein